MNNMVIELMHSSQVGKSTLKQAYFLFKTWPMSANGEWSTILLVVIHT